MLQLTGTFVSLLQTWMDQEQLNNKAVCKKLTEISNKKLIAIDTWNALLEQAAEEFEQPDLAIKMGKLVAIKHAGLIGYLLQSANSTFEAIQIYQACERRYYNTNFVSVDIENNSLVLSWLKTFSQDIDLAIQASISAFISFLQQEFPDSTKLLAVEACFARQKNVELFKSIYLCPIKTNKNCFKLSFELERSKIQRQDASLPLPRISVENQQTTFVLALIKSIKAQLPVANHSIENIAKLMGTSERSLQRKLQQNNLTFQALLDAVREQLACFYLKNTQLSGTEIALLLGFSEQSSYIRAFKLWKGQSPLKYKNSG